jgi:hypothetical protein
VGRLRLGSYEPAVRFILWAVDFARSGIYGHCMGSGAVEGIAVGPDAEGRTRISKWRGGGREIGWAPVRAEVLDYCSVALRRMGADTGAIAVTSTSRGEGRSTVALGLAAAASRELGRRTILVDLDLERGSLEKMTSAGPGPGVIEFLCEGAAVEDCLQTVDQKLEIVTAGHLGDRAGLAGQFGRLADLIAQLGDRCDVVIADLPPLSPGVTTARVADLFESVTVVVRAGGVAVINIEQCASVLSQRPFVILNASAESRRARIRQLLRTRS